MRSPTGTAKLQRLAAQAAHETDWVLTTWAHVIDAACLREASRHTSTSSAAGSAGGTAPQDAAHRAEHLHARHARRRRGCYQAPPVERVWLGQDDGGQRPLGEPTFEDKIVPRAVALRWAASDAPDFPDSAAGVRRGRRPHEALHERRERGMTEGLGWIVEADVSGHCERSDQPRCGARLRTRVKEGRLLRLLGTWLRAGVREEGVLRHPEPGVAQGGVISPVWANRFRHHVLDAWCEREVRPRMQGRGFWRRFAEDVVMGGEVATDARRIMAVLPQRVARLGLRMHPPKPALIALRKPEARQDTEAGNGTCAFLGLPHDGTRSRRGCWVLTRKTAKKRRRRTTKALWRGCRTNRHPPLHAQYRRLCLQLRGPGQSDGMRGTFRLLEGLAHDAEQAWRYGLSRRSSTSGIGGETFQKRLRVDPLPRPRIVHNI